MFLCASGIMWKCSVWWNTMLERKGEGKKEEIGHTGGCTLLPRVYQLVLVILRVKSSQYSSFSPRLG